MGLVASVSRHEPGAVSSMQNYGRPLFDRLFFLREPTASEPRQRSAARPGKKQQSKQQTNDSRYGTPVTARRRPAPEARAAQHEGQRRGRAQAPTRSSGRGDVRGGARTGARPAARTRYDEPRARREPRNHRNAHDTRRAG